ncbi:flagellar hook protein FlgE [Leifsonia sp. Leaf264]|uniref:flagellar hook protein FlgE n=1 Tax=Leifsonia sp. Leaf264 TaxID=1736314 RepID=UPI0006FFF701|nr:flagellar hook protein FlgE [Leifsonia sp. Leaf264]KQO98240.1 flagellar hook protein [Leifsonia sp. Leaf264]
MLRSLGSGISGMSSSQKMLDVTANNIANVNTTGFKASSVQFQDTLSQLLRGPGPGTPEVGGTNPAQVGLGVQVAGIATNFAQGSAKATGRASDMMIAGDGLFAVKQGGETLYTRAGEFDFDTDGRLVTPSGGLVQGWTFTDGVLNQGAGLQNIQLPLNIVSKATTTTAATITGNLPDDAAVGDVLVRDLDVYDAAGNKSVLSITFERTAAGWDVGDGSTVSGSLSYTGGALTGSGAVNVGGVDIDLSKTTGFAKLTTIALNGQDGHAAGGLDSYSIAPDGTVVGSFSNGVTENIARIALATFTNYGGLEKAGGSTYRETVNSGPSTLTTAGQNGTGALAAGYVEMSNVDLSQEFSNLIVAQRAFQANARIITTSDSVLEEVVNLKRG